MGPRCPASLYCIKDVFLDNVYDLSRGHEEQESYHVMIKTKAKNLST